MAKYYGRYTATAAKVIKNADRVLCWTGGADDSAGILICPNGHAIFKMTAEEYDLIARPVFGCDPGRFAFERGKRGESATDLSAYFAECKKDARERAAFRLAGMRLPADKWEMVGMYAAKKDAVKLFRADYVGIIRADCVENWESKPDAAAPILAIVDSEPIAAIWPISAKYNAAAVRAVRAWFDNTPATQSKKEQAATDADAAAKAADALNAEKVQRIAAESKLAAAEKELDARKRTESELMAEVARLKSKLAKMQQAARSVKPAAQPATKGTHAAPMTAAAVVTKWEAVNGITATVHGAKTAAPVVWLTGNTAPHADAIRAAGGAWSAKRSAFYFRCAA